MKKQLILLVGIIWMAQAFAGVIEPNITNFTKIKIVGEFEVVLKKGEEPSVKIDNRDSTLADDKIICQIKNGELQVRIKADTYKAWNMKVMITYTELEEVIARMGCALEFKTKIEQPSMAFQVESGSSLKAQVIVDTLIAESKTGAEVFLDGKAGLADYKASAGGTLGAIDVEAKAVSAEITAGGDIICWVLDDLKIKITTGGTVTYFGDPPGKKEKITFGGTVEKLAKRQ